MIHQQLMINWPYVLLLFILGYVTYKRKALDLLGSIFMILMGIIIIFSAGVNCVIILIIFLMLSLFATKFAKPYKKSLGEFEGKRTTKNVISNGIIAFMMAAFAGYYSPLVGGFIGAISTATADTLASEIGITQTPRLITTMKKVPPGTNGGVSILGTFAGIVGTVIIGICSFLLGIISSLPLAILISLIAGIFGCFVDSFLGAIFERKELLTNEHVNLIATIAGALMGIILIH